LFKGDWDELILKKRGVSDPWGSFPQNLAEIADHKQRHATSDAWIEEHRAELDAWHDAKKQIQNEFGCDVGYHCSGDCPMPYVFAHKVRACRGYPEQIVSLAVDPAWDELLDRFLAELGVEKPDGQVGPKWWLVSNWS
jgi:hypothetical protein